MGTNLTIFICKKLLNFKQNRKPFVFFTGNTVPLVGLLHETNRHQYDFHRKQPAFGINFAGTTPPRGIT